MKLIHTIPPPHHPDSVFRFDAFGARKEGSARFEPMMLLETDGGLVVVVGAASAPDGSEVPALVCPRDAPRDQVALHALARAAGELTAVERLAAVYKTARYVLEGVLVAPVPIPSLPMDRLPRELLGSYGALLGKPSVSEAFVLRLLAVLAYTTEDLERMHRLAFTVDHLIAILDSSAAERRAILSLHQRVPITVAETKKISHWLLFLRGRSHFDLERWMMDVTRKRDTQLNGSALIRSLRRTAHPTLTAKEDEIAAMLQRLKLPAGMKITYPEQLEGDSFSCYFDFSRIEELERKLDVIRAAIASGSIARMLDNLNNQEKE
jgi:hypothetical protein